MRDNTDVVMWNRKWSIGSVAASRMRKQENTESTNDGALPRASFETQRELRAFRWGM